MATPSQPSNTPADIGIPKFYFPKSAPDLESIDAFRATISEAFAPHGGSVNVAELHAILPKTCGCPGYLAYQLMDKLCPKAPGEPKVSVAKFVQWWEGHHLIDNDSDSCVFHIIKKSGEVAVRQEELLTFMQHVLRHHPGLEFLQVGFPCCLLLPCVLGVDAALCAWCRCSYVGAALCACGGCSHADLECLVSAHCRHRVCRTVFDQKQAAAHCRHRVCGTVFTPKRI